MLRHALSVDVEDWNNGAHLLVTKKVTPPTSAVVRNTERMFRLVEAAGFRATWFFLGEVVAHFPHLVRMAASAGHELGVHGYHHHLVHELSPRLFGERARAAKDRVEQVAGVRVLGYRAAAASITHDTRWALDVLAEVGFAYDSSLFPYKRPPAGGRADPVEPHWVSTAGGRPLYEVPLTVLDLAGVRLPACGGGFLRHFPWAYTAAAMRILERRGRRAVVYLHPYELDTQPPTAPFARLGLMDRLRFEKLRYFQYRNRRQTETKLENLWAGRSFGPIAEVFDIQRLVDGRHSPT